MSANESRPIQSDEDVLEHYEAAKLLLAQNPVTTVHVLGTADTGQLAIIWVAWADKADAIAKYAGNTLAREFVVRTGLFAAVGIVLGWLIAGLPLGWFGSGLGLAAGLWWLLRRRAWQRSAAFHVVWGALIKDEHNQRYQANPTELMKAAQDKVEQNVINFAKEYEAWVGHPLARRLG